MIKARIGHDGSRWVDADICSWPHLLVGGASGNGKSVFLRQMLYSIFRRYSPKEVQAVAFDFKRVEFSAWKDLPWVRQVAVEADEASSAMAWLDSEISRRLRALDKAKAVDWSARRGPFILLVVDEYAQFHAEFRLSPETAMMSRVFRLGRAAGIHGIIATQKPTSDVISLQVKANCEASIAFRTRNWRESQNIIDSKGAELLPCPGRAIYSFGGRQRVVQVPYISLRDTIKRLEAHARERGYERPAEDGPGDTTGRRVESLFGPFGGPDALPGLPSAWTPGEA